MTSTALMRIPVGVVVERHKATSPWLSFLWRPVSVLVGVPAAAPWTPIASHGDVTQFYAGHAVIDLFRTEAEFYRSNILSGAPVLWVVLREAAGEPPLDLLAVTADPAEGEALTGAGNDLVETVPMPASIVESIEAFVAEHYVERPMYRRQRDRSGQPPARTGNGPEQSE